MEEAMCVVFAAWWVPDPSDRMIERVEVEPGPTQKRFGKFWSHSGQVFGSVWERDSRSPSLRTNP